MTLMTAWLSNTTNHKNPILKYEGLGIQLMHAASLYYREKAYCNKMVKGYLPCSPAVSHPVPRKKERRLHTCAQDVKITRTANNMVNRYNISLNYKLESLQNDPWVQKEILQSGAEI
jgi:hypothetical protein